MWYERIIDTDGKIAQNSETGFEQRWFAGYIRVIQSPMYPTNTWGFPQMHVTSIVLSSDKSLVFLKCLFKATRLVRELERRTGEKIERKEQFTDSRLQGVENAGENATAKTTK